MNKPRFHLIGAAGYIARKHLDAIKHVGGELVSACDITDSVGILDSFDKECHFTTNDRSAKARYQAGDYVIVCSPNYMHADHCSDALFNGANVICEKPMVVNESHLNRLEKALKYAGVAEVYPVLQMRYHPIVNWLNSQPTTVKGKINYTTPRGYWYASSWKTDPIKSGGLMLNIGIHLFDLMIYCYGPVSKFKIHYSEWNRAAGKLLFDSGREVEWFISLDPKDAPNGPNRQFTFGEETRDIEGTPDLHNKLYTAIMEGSAPSFEDAVPALKLVFKMRKKAKL
jgi:UDP-N-acetyl-2-amino-2-deoxyglucuronate dehydrogenase